MTNHSDYYQILGVSPNASQEEIDKAYQKLAMKWHPDRHPLPEKKAEAEEKMKEINQAYEVLGNSQKRSEYDRHGTAENFAQDFPDEGFGRGDFFKDFIDTFFGGRTGKQKGYESNRPQAGSDILINITLNFKESVVGAKKKVTLDLKKACQTCRQTGAHSPTDIVTCPNCQGRGEVNTVQRTVLGVIRTQTTCPRCEGRGKIIKKSCGQCLGKKFLSHRETIEFNIPRGIQPDEKLRYQEIGHDGLYGGHKGDIYVSIKTQVNPYFQRKGNDIHVNLPISFLDAILGGNIEVITLEGVEKITIPAGTQNNDCLVLRNRGCYLGINKASRGHFHIWLQIKLPKKITKLTEEMLRKLKNESTWNPNRDFIEKNEDIIDK